MQIPYSQTIYLHYPFYNGSDLGLTYSKEGSHFRAWSPPASEAQIRLYKDATGDLPFQIVNLQKGDNGSWHTYLTGDWKNTFYTIRVRINNQWSNEVMDPYARAAGINSTRAMIVDLRETDPPFWAEDQVGEDSKIFKKTDAIIYELHVRDASIHPCSGIVQKGLFSGLGETGTTNMNGLATGLDHLKELGVTHIQLLPVFDFFSVDPGKPQYSWGYDPLNYNIPEGSYSSNPCDGVTRIKELKQMIASFHQNGFRVIMDVVYNHTANALASNFNQLVPGYYYRHNDDGSFSNASACGNELASERPMMRKCMLESVLYLVKEYHIDGFRFDLMGVHDIETMNSISAALHAIKPGILLYGEGWTADASPLPESLRACKHNASRLEGIAVYGDELRDGIKGSVFDLKGKGFVAGNAGFSESVKFGIVACCYHPQIDYKHVIYSKKPYATKPGNIITYCECHDNHTLWDRLALSGSTESKGDRKRMHRLALTIVLTSQGIPLLHAGTEFMRSKNGVENSYNSGDHINAIDWDLKTENIDLTRYVEKLIRMRKGHPSFRMANAEDIRQNIHFDEQAPFGSIVYTINGEAMNDSWEKIWIAFNGTGEGENYILPPGNWKNALEVPSINAYAVMFHLEKYSAAILYRE